MQPPLILASSSPYRKTLLARLGVPFTAEAPAIDETPSAGEPVAALVRRLAIEKARALRNAYPRHIIVGSDQAAEFDGKPVGKPGNRERAVAQLRAMSGRRIIFHTGVCVYHSGLDRHEVAVVETEVEFRRNPEARIARYLELEPAFDCAGSFKSESLGIALCRRVTSEDPTALVGLPLLALVDLLGQFGFELPAGSPNTHH